jgi:hypothetical protein
MHFIARNCTVFCCKKKKQICIANFLLEISLNVDICDINKLYCTLISSKRAGLQWFQTTYKKLMFEGK